MRDLTASVIAAITAGRVRPVVFYEGVYSSGTLRLWSGITSVSWDGQTWLGAGNLLNVAPIQELSEVRAAGFAVSLSGDSSALLALNIGAVRQGLAGRVWIGFLDDTGAIIADPFKAFEGRLDVPDIVDEGERCTISVRYESRLIDLDRSRERRYTTEDQQLDYASDRGFDFVPSIQDAVITWGNGVASVPTSAAPRAPIAPDPGGFNSP